MAQLLLALRALIEVLKGLPGLFRKKPEALPAETAIDEKIKKDAETGRPGGFWDEGK